MLLGSAGVYITPQSANLGRGAGQDVVRCTGGPVQRGRPQVHRGRPHGELTALATAQRIALQQPRDLTQGRAHTYGAVDFLSSYQVTVRGRLNDVCPACTGLGRCWGSG